MAGEALVETLELDIQPALTALVPLDAALGQIVTAFSGDLGDAISNVLGRATAIDTTPLTTAVETAITDATSTPVPVSGDLSALDVSLADALDAPRSVPVEADTTAIVAEIGAATDVTQTVPVDADVTAAAAAVSGLDVAVTVPVDADTTPAQVAIGEIVAQPIDIPVDANTTDAVAAIDNLTAQPADLTVVAETSEASTAIDALTAPATLTVDGDVTALNAALTDALDAPRDVPVDGDTSALVAAISSAADVPQTVPVDADTTNAQIAIGALAADTVSVAVDADTTGLEGSIAQAADIPQTVPVDGDTTALAANIAGVADTPVTVPVDADTAPAVATIDSLTAAPIVVSVQADTTEATSAITDLGDAATGAVGTSGGSGGGGSGIAGLVGSLDGIDVGTGIASGNVRGLADAIGGISESSALAVGGGVALTAFIGDVVSKAADAEAQQRRFNEVFGESAQIVQSINVGGLVSSLADLGRQSGTSSTDLETAATKIGLLGTASGATQPQVADVAQKMLGLGAALAVQNPQLGDAAQVTETLTQAFASGRTRGLIPYGISLANNAITQEALKENIGATTATLTPYQKLLAGVTLTLQQQGDTLGTKYAAGLQNAQVQLRALKVQLEETLTAVGGPLLQPVVASLQSVLPVAQQVGIAFGAIAQVILPFVTSLAPVLIPVAGALHLVSDGLGFIAAALSHLPPPVLAAIAIGILAIGVNSATAFGLVGAAITAFEAINPVLLGITLGLVALGGIVDAFGGHADGAKSATKAWGDALFGAGSGASTLSDQVHALDSNITKTVTSFVESARAGSDFRNVLDGVGGGVSGVQKALTGSDAEFKTFLDAVTATKDGTFGAQIASDAYTIALENQRKGLLDSEAGQVANLLSTKQVTQAQVDAARAAVIAKDGYLNLGDQLKILSGEADAAAEAQQKNTLASSVSSGAIRGLVDAFNPASGSIVNFTQDLQDAGLAQADAKKLADDTAKAYQDQRDKTILAGTAVGDLNLKFIEGSIGAGQLEGDVAGLGVSVGAAAKDVSDLTGEIDSFAKSAVSALPQAGTAVADFTTGVNTAFSNLVSASKAGGTAVDSAQKAVSTAQDALARAQASAATSAAKSATSAQNSVTTAQDALNRAQASASTSAAKSIANAQLSLDAANRRVAALQGLGTASASAITSAQLAVTTAQDKLNQVIANGSTAGATSVQAATERVARAREALNQTISAGGAAGATSVKNAQDQLARANQNLVDAQNKAGVDVKAAQAALEKAVDPQSFIDTLTKEAKAIGDFQKNLGILVAEGLGNLAGVLAQKGADAGGALAQAFVGDHTKALLADGAVRSVTVATDAYKQFAASPTTAAAMGAAGQSLADPLNRGFAGHFAITHATQDQINAAALLVAASEPQLTGVAQGLARAGVVAFDAEFGRLPTIAEIQSGATQKALTDSGPGLKTAAGTAAGAATAGFTPDFAGQTAGALTDSKGQYDATHTIPVANAARIGGRIIGAQFDLGIRDGLTNPFYLKEITDAGGTAAQAAITGANKVIRPGSPSLAGVEIGENFIAGIAEGFDHTGPLSAVVDQITATIASIGATPIAPLHVAVEVDQSALAAVHPAPAIIPVTADTTAAVASLAAIPKTALPTVIPVQADPSGFLADVTTARATATGHPATVAVEADTSPLDTALKAVHAPPVPVAFDTTKLVLPPIAPPLVPVTLDTAKAHVQLADLATFKLPPVALAPTAVTAAAATQGPDLVDSIARALVRVGTAAAPQPPGAGPSANIHVELHKVDVNPFDLANELSWRLG